MDDNLGADRIFGEQVRGLFMLSALASPIVVERCYLLR